MKMKYKGGAVHRNSTGTISGYGVLRTGFFPEIVLRQGSMFPSDRMDLD